MAETPQEVAAGDPLARVEAFLGDWPHGDVLYFGTTEDVGPLTITDIRVLVAEVKQARAGSAADLRAVRDVLTAWNEVDIIEDDRYLRATLDALATRFGERVEQLDARDEPHSCGNCEGIAVDSCVNFRAEESMRDEQEQNCGNCGCVGCHQCDPRERLGGN